MMFIIYWMIPMNESECMFNPPDWMIWWMGFILVFFTLTVCGLAFVVFNDVWSKFRGRSE